MFMNSTFNSIMPPPLLLLLLLFASASAAISEDVVGQLFVNQRRLLQLKKPCGVNFQNQNYSVLTSQCSAPDYPPEPCCSGLKELACPFAAEINDLTTDCSEVFFSYITKVGEYPAGLFGSICREDKDGLQCPAASPPPPLSSFAPPMLLLFPLFFFVLPLYFLL